MRQNALVLSVFLLAAQAGWADLTVRQKLVMKFGTAMPASVVDTVKKQMGDTLPAETTLRVKGNKCSTSGGVIGTITDYDKDVVTLVNGKTKQFATVPIAEYTSKILTQQQVPETTRKALADLKLDVQTTKTGQSDVIQGIRAEEHLVVLSVGAPGAAGGIRMEMRNWMATTEELDRNPALKEWAACSAPANNPNDLGQAMQRMFVQLPILSDKFVGTFEELRKNSGGLSVKTQAAMFAPDLIVMVQKKGRSSAPGFDPNAPAMEMTTDLAGFSTDPLPDSAFAVPAGYQEAPVEDLIKAMLPELASAQSPAPASNTTQPLPPGVYRIGAGVSAPSVISKRDPKYSKEARRAKIQGTVRISLVVDEHGTPQDLRVVKSLDPGLDEKAIEAVRDWKFQPGQKNGQPVPVLASVEVNFKLLDNPPVR